MSPLLHRLYHKTEVSIASLKHTKGNGCSLPIHGTRASPKACYANELITIDIKIRQVKRLQMYNTASSDIKKLAINFKETIQ